MMAGDAPRKLIAVLIEAFSTGSFSLDLWADTIMQYRYMSLVGFDRLISVQAIRPINNRLGEDEDPDDPDKPQLMSYGYLIPEKKRLWDPSMLRRRGLPFSRKLDDVQYHGTDVSRARLEFPEIADVIGCPWPYGQPRLVR
jgi:hypothetical protein